MRRALAIIIAGILALTLCGCESGSQEIPENPESERFWLSGTGLNYRIIEDRVTGVYYLVLMKNANGIAVTPLLNSDGSPSRVDNADYDDVKADIAANLRRWQESQ